MGDADFGWYFSDTTNQELNPAHVTPHFVTVSSSLVPFIPFHYVPLGHIPILGAREFDLSLA